MFVDVLLLTLLLFADMGEALQHAATHCSTLQHTATHDILWCTRVDAIALFVYEGGTGTHWNTLQHTATRDVRGCFLVGCTAFFSYK